MKNKQGLFFGAANRLKSKQKVQQNIQMPKKRKTQGIFSSGKLIIATAEGTIGHKNYKCPELIMS